MQKKLIPATIDAPISRTGFEQSGPILLKQVDGKQELNPSKAVEAGIMNRIKSIHKNVDDLRVSLLGSNHQVLCGSLQSTQRAPSKHSKSSTTDSILKNSVIDTTSPKRSAQRVMYSNSKERGIPQDGVAGSLTASYHAISARAPKSSDFGAGYLMNGKLKPAIKGGIPEQVSQATRSYFHGPDSPVLKLREKLKSSSTLGLKNCLNDKTYSHGKDDKTIRSASKLEIIRKQSDNLMASAISRPDPLSNSITRSDAHQLLNNYTKERTKGNPGLKGSQTTRLVRLNSAQQSPLFSARDHAKSMYSRMRLCSSQSNLKSGVLGELVCQHEASSYRLQSPDPDPDGASVNELDACSKKRGEFSKGVQQDPIDVYFVGTSNDKVAKVRSKLGMRSAATEESEKAGLVKKLGVVFQKMRAGKVESIAQVAESVLHPVQAKDSYPDAENSAPRYVKIDSSEKAESILQRFASKTEGSVGEMLEQSNQTPADVLSFEARKSSYRIFRTDSSDSTQQTYQHLGVEGSKPGESEGWKPKTSYFKGLLMSHLGATYAPRPKANDHYHLETAARAKGSADWSRANCSSQIDSDPKLPEVENARSGLAKDQSKTTIEGLMHKAVTMNKMLKGWKEVFCPELPGYCESAYAADKIGISVGAESTKTVFQNGMPVHLEPHYWKLGTPKVVAIDKGMGEPTTQWVDSVLASNLALMECINKGLVARAMQSSHPKPQTTARLLQQQSSTRS